MSGLRALQAAFTRRLLDGNPSVAEHIAATGGPSIARRLDVYANAYHARLIEALATDFQALEKVLGEEAFAQLCRDYVANHPSTCPSLRWLGSRLPAFLAQARIGKPDLTEMARFEWTLAAAFDAPDTPIAGIEEAGRLPAEAWPVLRLSLHPSVHRLDLNWNTMARWRAAKDGTDIPLAEHLREPGTCLIWREGLTTRYRSLEADEAMALEAAASGADFGEICTQLETFAGDQEATALRAAGLLKGWLGAGLVKELKA
jgi:hypothetical protein